MVWDIFTHSDLKFAFENYLEFELQITMNLTDSNEFHFMSQIYVTNKEDATTFTYTHTHTHHTATTPCCKRLQEVERGREEEREREIGACEIW